MKLFRSSNRLQDDLISPHINSDGVKTFAVLILVMRNQNGANLIALSLSLAEISGCEDHNTENANLDTDHVVTDS